ncbi:hypothetical protein FAF44_07655 [Nonomuraea sp. MG754425]|uniref:DUF6153 family protein n=1 Tax=Nonomuraea sp. MG754425 TaxID=2570319 RepID=UPI001F45C18E|nr:DUF6153 family protein [Nonomuraea sp. MG754425]MCF6468276.1 hypothetical protein [Nonomuraea sp. MG754425]
MWRRRAIRATRVLLLVALALGVLGMHTLGHLDGRHGGSSSRGHAMEAVQTPLAVVPAGLQAFVPEQGTPGFDPTDVCLAILMSLIVVLLGSAWIRAGRRADATGGRHSSVRQVARPPPKRTSQRLATLSILRT